jgi:hypothetical protein
MPGALFGDVFPTGGGSRDLTGTTDSSKYAMGTHWRPSVDGTVTAVRWFVPTGLVPSNADFAAGLAQPNAGGLGAGVTWLDWNTGVTRPGAGAAGTWVTLPLGTPQHVVAGTELYAVIRTDRYGFAQHIFDTGSTFPGADGNTVLVGDGIGGAGFPNGGFVTGGGETSNPPNFTAPSSFNASFYGVDVLFTPDGAPPASTERWGIPL